jgi:hypothetical protein
MLIKAELLENEYSKQSEEWRVDWKFTCDELPEWEKGYTTVVNIEDDDTAETVISRTKVQLDVAMKDELEVLISDKEAKQFVEDVEKAFDKIGEITLDEKDLEKI